MTDPRRPFLDAIRAAPDDDLPRMVYADYLEKHGESARAEFIRCQCMAARLEYDVPARDQPERRASELLRRHSGEEAFAFIAKTGDGLNNLPNRGFLESFSAPAAWLMEFGGAYIDAEPISKLRLWLAYQTDPAVAARLASWPHLDRVSDLELLGEWSGSLPGLLASPHLGRLAHLRLPFVPTPDDVNAVVNCARLAELKGLHWWGGFPDTSRPEPDIARALAASPHVRTLTELSLNAGAARPDTLAVLAEAANFARLERLKLCAETFDSDAVARFARSETITRLRTLVIASIGSELDFATFARWPGLAALDSFVLDVDEVDVRAAHALADWPGLGGVHCLHLAADGDEAEVLAALAGSRYLGGLRELRLCMNLPPEAAEAIHGLGVANLRKFSLSSGELSPAAAQILAVAPWFGRLTGLAISNNRSAGDECAAVVAASPASARLTKLDLTRTGMTDAGAEVLAASAYLLNLLELSVQQNAITDRGARALADSPRLGRLRRLVIDLERFDDTTLAALNNREI